MTVSTLPSHVADGFDPDRQYIQTGPRTEERIGPRAPATKRSPPERVERSEQCQRQTTEVFEGAVVGDQCQLADEGEGGEVSVHPQRRRCRSFDGELLPAAFDAGRFSGPKFDAIVGQE